MQHYALNEEHGYECPRSVISTQYLAAARHVLLHAAQLGPRALLSRVSFRGAVDWNNFAGRTLGREKACYGGRVLTRQQVSA